MNDVTLKQQPADPCSPTLGRRLILSLWIKEELRAPGETFPSPPGEAPRAIPFVLGRG